MQPAVRPIRVLVAEDDYLLADGISTALLRAGALVVGPVATLSETIGVLLDPQPCDAAVLDINLRGEMVFPAADELDRLSVGFVFYSGYDEIRLPERFAQRTRLSKSSSFAELTSAVFDERQRGLEDAFGPDLVESDCVQGEATISSLLPRLRMEARLLLGDAAAADDLVARALEEAIALAERQALSGPLADTLVALVRTVHRNSRI